MILPLLLFVLLAASARCDCDACIDGWCHSRKLLIEGFDVTDQLAIDQTNNVLYVQINFEVTVAVYLDELKIKHIQTLKTSGMTVNQDTHDLYVADYNKNIYKYEYENKTIKVAFINNHEPDIDRMFYRDDTLYYTSRHKLGLNFIEENGTFKIFTLLKNMTITNFAVVDYNEIYFVTDGKVYKHAHGLIDLVAEKDCVLQIDKYDGVYLGDANMKVIFKLKESGELEEYGVYKSGKVDGFVFDKDNGIVFHDADDGSVATWKKYDARCNVHQPHAAYFIESEKEEHSVEDNQK